MSKSAVSEDFGPRTEDDAPETLSNKMIFAREFVRTRNRSLAAKLAGSKGNAGTLDTMAWRWIHDPEVIREIKRLDKLAEKRAVMQAAELDASVEALIQANPQDLVDPETGEVKALKDMPRALCHAIAEYHTETRYDKAGNKIVTRKVKLHNKKESAELLMKRKKLLKESQEADVRVRFTFGKKKPVKKKGEDE